MDFVLEGIAEHHARDKGCDEPVSANQFGPDIRRKRDCQKGHAARSFCHQVAGLGVVHCFGDAPAKRDADQWRQDYLQHDSRRQPVGVRALHARRRKDRPDQDEGQNQSVIQPAFHIDRLAQMFGNVFA